MPADTCSIGGEGVGQHVGWLSDQEICRGAGGIRKESTVTSAKQAAANRRNAQRSTGPKTRAGKAIARLNAVKHGGLSPLAVIPNMESQEEWEAHRAGTLASLEPAGPLETVFAERVASLLWRLHRVARYEREVIAVSQEQVEDDLATERQDSVLHIVEDFADPQAIREQHQRAQERVSILESVDSLPDEAPIDGEDAQLILVTAAKQTPNVDFTQGFPLPGMPHDVRIAERLVWTAGLLRGTLDAIALQAKMDRAELLRRPLEQARYDATRRKAAADHVATDLDRMRRQRLLPEGATLVKLTRYEAHLSRQLNQALHELQRLQARRAGQAVPPRAALDVALSGPA